MYEKGFIYDVRLAVAGSYVTDDTAAGATVLFVDDAVDFVETGGTLTIHGTNYDYVSADMEADSITLAAPLAVALDAADAVEAYPRVVSKEAAVVVPNYEDAISARVPHALHDRLPLGIRDEAEREYVGLSDESGFWTVADVFADAPVIDGAYLEEGTVDTPALSTEVTGSIQTAADAAAQALNDAESAMNFAETKNSVYRQPTKPTSGVKGDTWFDTDDGNRIYVHDGTDYVDSQDTGISAAVKSYVTEYAVNASETTPPTTGWSTATPARTPGTFVWFRTTVTYNDGTSSTTNPALLTGNTGATGPAGTAAAVVALNATTQVLVSPAAGGATNPTTAVVTGTGTNTLTVFEYSVNGGEFSTSVPAGVSRSGNVVTITGSTMTARTITVRMADAAGVADTLTVAKVLDGATGATGATGAPGADGVDGQAGADAYTVLLTNEANVFAGSVSAAVAGNTTTSVIAYKGASQVPATIGNITGQVTGLTTSISNNGTNTASVTITVTTSLTTPKGELTIPLTVDGKSFTKKFSWSVSYKGATGSQGIQGPAGADGTTYYTWLKYADTPTTGMSDSPTGKTYMGLAYNKTSSTESTNYSDYSWSLIKGADGTDGAQGVQGPAGADGQSLFTWVKYGTSSTGAGMSDSPTGKTYIGLAYNKTTATESSTATDYTWSLIQGPKGDTGAQGPQGIQGSAGADGADGQSLFTWLKYADTPTSGMSDSPTGKTYMGVAYNKTTATESAVYGDYQWSLIKGADGTDGAQGIQGPAGSDGQSLYTWIKYADTASGTGMSDSPTGKTYIGFAFNKTTATESTTATDYQWSLIQGPQGPQGIAGTDGADAPGIYLTANSQVLTAPATGGATTPATATVTGAAINTTITAWTYSVDGGAFTATVPAGVSRSGNVVTITGSTMTAKTIAVKMADAGGVSDTLTVAKVSNGATGATGATGTNGTNGLDAYTVLLTNEANVFPAGTTNANAGSTTTSVIAYKGATQTTATIGTITGQVTGLTTAITNNGTNNATVTVTVTTSLTQNGTLTIPVTVDGKSFTKKFSWSLSKTGATGSQGVQGTPGTNGANGVSVTSITPYYAQVATGASAPAKPTTSTPNAPWVVTEPTYVVDTELYRTDRIGYSDSTYAYTTVVKVSAYTAAVVALDAANGKNKIIFSTSDASGTNYAAGDLWYKKSGNDIIGVWEFVAGSPGSWVTKQLRDEVLKSLNVGKLTAGNISAITMNVSSSGVIKSNNYAASSAGWKLDANGLEMNSGTITGPLIQTQSTAARGIKINSTGLSAYDNSGVKTLDITSAGAITLKGSITAGSDINGANITASSTGVVQTESTASRGIKMNSSGLTAYDNTGNPTLTITGSTGAVAMKGILTAGSNIIGSSLSTGTTGPRIVMGESNGIADGAINFRDDSGGKDGQITFNRSLSSSNLTLSSPNASGATDYAYVVLEHRTASDTSSITLDATDLDMRANLDLRGSMSHFQMIGEVRMFAGTTLSDTNWMFCQGQTLVVVDYQSLFNVIGYTYGGSGTTFNLPDFSAGGTGRFPMGPDSTHSVGTSGGSKTINANNLPPHTHGMNHNHTIQARSTGPGTNSNRVAASSGASNEVNNNTAPNAYVGDTSNGGFANADFLPPYLTISFIIRVK